GRARNGCGGFSSSSRISRESGKKTATTCNAIPGRHRAMPVPQRRERLEWQAAEVREIVPETTRVSSLVLDVPGWRGHLPGQHVSIRLTGEDGYQALRLDSIASPPEMPQLVLTVERIDDGEVSPYLVGELRPGDRFELRGPIG